MQPRGNRQMLRARWTMRHANPAKEGDAIPVSSTRSSLRDHYAKEPPLGQAPDAPYAADPHASGEPSRCFCPVLARIPDAAATPARPSRRTAAGTQRPPYSPQAPSEPFYRVDPPQPFAPHRGHAASANEPSHRPPYLLASPTRPTFDDADSLPIPIRLAVRTWRFFQPHQPLLRVSAMFALVAAGGMSTALMVGGGGWRSHGGPPSPTAVAVEQTAPNGDRGSGLPGSPAAESATDIHPARHLDGDQDASTSYLAPTAIGPAGATGRASDGLVSGPQSIAPDMARPEQPTTAVDATPPPIVPPYPTTSYPRLSLPGSDYGPMPQTRLAEPPAAVACLQGYIEEVQPR
jgi:hypothetical protein